jgi:hypothetical protein
MSEIQEILVHGYHGTTVEKAEVICREGFRDSTNDYDWLGKGIYFWQDAPELALIWARRRHRNSDLAVIYAEIMMNIDLTIDLFDSNPDNGYIQAFRDSYKRFRDLISTMPRTEQQGLFHRLDKLMIDFAVDNLIPSTHSGKKIQVVRSVFIHGEPLFPPFEQNEKSALHDMSHVQIAVRDHNVIRSHYRI